jgi:cytochrome c556
VLRRTITVTLLLACALAGGARAADDATPATDAASDVKRSGNVLKMRKTAPPVDHAPTVESFVQLALTQNVDAVYKTFGDVPVQANGELALKNYLATEVLPFFADVERLDPSLRVVGATFEDDSRGQIAYAYAVTKAGRIKPFTIAWRVEQGRARLMDVKVDRCVPSRHPVVSGGCAR